MLTYPTITFISIVNRKKKKRLSVVLIIRIIGESKNYKFKIKRFMKGKKETKIEDKIKTEYKNGKSNILFIIIESTHRS